MAPSSNNRIDAFDPLLAVRACLVRWRLAAAILVVTTVLAIIAALQIKPKFESEASIFVRLGRESAGLDPTATTSEITPIYETREQELNSTIEVMNSRKLLEAVIGVIGEDVVLEPSRFNFERWQQALSTATWPELDPTTIHRSNAQKEIAVEKIYRAITLEVERSSSVIGLTSTALTPDLAQAITRTMLEAFRAEHVRLNQTHGLTFFEEQVGLLQSQLEDVRVSIRERKNALGIMSIEGERSRLEDLLTTLEKQLNVAVPDLEGAKASAKVMERQVADLPDRTQPHDANDTLRKKLHELQQRRTVLLTKFTSKHFRVRDLDAQLKLVGQQLSDPSNRNTANPTLRELEVLLANERTRIAQTSAQIEELQKEQRRLRNQLVSLNDAETEMLEFADRESELKASLAKATEKREQARLLDQLSQQRISNIQVVQPPTFNPTSISPSRSLVVIAGTCVGLVGACVIPAIIEFLLWYVQFIRSGAATAAEGDFTEELVACGG